MNDLDRNKANVTAFYRMMFDECRPGEAIELFAGDDYVQHDPQVATGMDRSCAATPRTPRARRSAPPNSTPPPPAPVGPQAPAPRAPRSRTPPRRPRSASIACIRRRTGSSRVRSATPCACRSALFAAMKRIAGRGAASQTASAPAASFFRRFTNGLARTGGTARTSRPGSKTSRARPCALAPASIAAAQRGGDSSARTRPRDACLRNAADPSARTPCRWKLRFSGSMPIVRTSVTDASSFVNAPVSLMAHIRCRRRGRPSPSFPRKSV